MNSKVKTITVALALIVVVAVAASGYNYLSENYTQPSDSSSSSESDASDLPEEQRIAEQNQMSESKEIQKAPDFIVFDVKGNEVRFSDYAGKPIVLNFWASWCPPCKAELPDFENAYLEQKEDVVFLMVNMTDGQRETQEKAFSYIEDKEYTFPVFYDLDMNVASVYGITSLPTTVFIDESGVLKDAYIGQINEETLLKGIEKIL